MLKLKQMAGTQERSLRHWSDRTTRVRHRISDTLKTANNMLIVSGQRERKSKYQFIVASQREDRVRAYTLAYDVYRAAGLV